MLIVEVGEIASFASCIVTIANRSKTVAGILTRLNDFCGGTTIGDRLTENAIRSCN